MQFFCDVEKPDNTPFGGNCRGFLRDINCRFKQLGLRCNVGTECEFYPVSYTHLFSSLKRVAMTIA